MALKSIFEIDVNDTKFQNFVSLLQTYQDALGKLPRGWADVGKAITSVSSATIGLDTKIRTQAKKIDAWTTSLGKFKDGLKEAKNLVESLVKASDKISASFDKTATSMKGVSGAANVVLAAATVAASAAQAAAAAANTASKAVTRLSQNQGASGGGDGGGGGNHPIAGGGGRRRRHGLFAGIFSGGSNRGRHGRRHGFGGYHRHVLRHAGIRGVEWGGLLSLAGFGGLFGIDVLAEHASNLRVESRGLGVSPMALQGAEVGLQPFGINAKSALANIQAAQLSMNPVPFNLLGVPGAMNEKGTGALINIIQAVRKKYKELQDKHLLFFQPWFKSASGLLGQEGAIVAARTPQAESNMWIKMMKQSEKDLGLTKGSLLKAQEVKMQFGILGKAVEDQLLSLLKPLMPQVQELSKAFGGLMKYLLSTKVAGPIIIEMTDALKYFNKEVRTQEFKENVKNFIYAIGQMATVLVRFTELVFGKMPHHHTSDKKQSKLLQWEKQEAAALEVYTKKHPFLAKFHPNLSFGNQPLPGGLTGPEYKQLSRFDAWETQYTVGSTKEPFDKWIQTHPIGKLSALTHVSGPIASKVISEMQAHGASQNFITGALSAALGEGGLAVPWQHNLQGSSARGLWQFLRGGELTPYYAAGGKRGSVSMQTAYMVRRLHEIDPNIDHASRAQVANDFAKFERSGQGASYYAAHWTAAKAILDKYKNIHPSHTAAAHSHGASGQQANKTMTPVKGGHVVVTVNNNTGGSAAITTAQVGQ